MSRFIAYQVRPVVEWNDESKDSIVVESFHSLSEAQQVYEQRLQQGIAENPNIHSFHKRDEDKGTLRRIIADVIGLQLYWTLYGCLSDGTAEAIGDFRDEGSAFATLAKITGIVGVSGIQDYTVPGGPYQGDFIGDDGSIIGVIVAPEDILAALSEEEYFNILAAPSEEEYFETQTAITLEQARAYLAEHRENISDAMTVGWPDVLRDYINVNPILPAPITPTPAPTVMPQVSPVPHKYKWPDDGRTWRP